MQEVAVDLTGNVSCFSQYGKPYQEKIFQGLLMDREWASQMYEVMLPTFFELNYLKYLTRLYFRYYEQYKAFPTLQLLISIIREDLSEGQDIILRDQIVEFLHRLKSNPHPGDIGYVKDKALDFCKRQAFKDALHKAVELIQTDKFDSVISLMKDAVSIGMPHSIGHDFHEDIEARFVKAHRIPCPTGLPRIDAPDILDGGLGRGEIGVVTANTGVGKSHYLVAMGANALRSGKNVLHYTFELTETAVGRRYDSNLTNIDINDLMSSKKKVLDFYEKEELGRLIIKEYPTGAASVITIRNHIEKLSLKGFKPSLIVVDYADIMKDTSRAIEIRHALGSIYEELRGLAGELEVPVWTASQANRSALEEDVIEASKVSESYQKVMTADFVFSLSRKMGDKAADTGRFHIIKNRFGPDGITFPSKINTDIGLIEIYESSTRPGQEQQKKIDSRDYIERKMLGNKYKHLLEQS